MMIASLRARLMLLMVVALAPAVALVVYLGHREYRSAESAIQQQTRHQVQLVVKDQEGLVVRAAEFLAALARDAQVRQAREDCSGFLAGVLARNPEYTNIGVVDLEGRILCSALPVPAGVNHADHAYLRRVIATRAFAVGEYQIGRISGKPTLYLGAPLLGDRFELLGAVFAGGDLQRLGQLYAKGGLPQGSLMVAFDARGTVLARYPDTEQWIGSQFHDAPLIRAIQAGKGGGVIEIAGLDGVPRLFAYETLLEGRGGEVYVAVGVPSSVAYATARAQLLWSLGALLVVSMIVLALAWVGGNALIARPIGALIAAAKQLRSGDYGARSGLGHAAGEIGQLATVFDGMAKALQKRHFEVEQLKFAIDEHAIVSVAGLDGKIIFVNDKFVEISQYSREELLGQDHRILNSGYHDQAFFAEMWRTISGGLPWQGVIRNLSKDGNYYWVATTIVPVIGTDGRHHYYISIRTDITHLKRTEEQMGLFFADLELRVAERTQELSLTKAQLEADIEARNRTETELLKRNTELTALNQQLSDAQNQLMQSEKMASVGQLAAGVAHEINNPIGYVHSNLGALENYLGDLFKLMDGYREAEAAMQPEHAAVQALQRLKSSLDLDFLREDLPALMSESKEGITRVRKIVQDLKDFSRVDSTQEWQWSNLHQGLDSTLNIVASEIKYRADVSKNYGSIPDIECLPSQINQVFMNLLVNAAHAIQGARGTITLSTGQEGDSVWVEVADTGSGIAQENLSRIFDPFFTTKPVGKGTGLGLSLSYGIVQKHNGRIEVTSEPGKGTTFRVILPIHQIERRSATQADQAAEPAKAAEEVSA